MSNDDLLKIKDILEKMLETSINYRKNLEKLDEIYARKMKRLQNNE